MAYHDDEGYGSRELFKIGRNGPLHISLGAQIPEFEDFRARLAQAWVSNGKKITEDTYSGTQDGLFKSVNSTYKGLRSSSWVFVDGKPNVRILPETLVTKIQFDQGNVARGVTVMYNDEEVTFAAKREFIVSAGVFETPKLLMLSGIGPKDGLKQHGIQVLVNSPHVGQNLLDHPILSHVFRVQDGYGLDKRLLRAGPMNKAAVQQYEKDHSGPLSSTLLEIIGFSRVDDRLNRCKDYVEYKQKTGGIDPFDLRANRTFNSILWYVSFSAAQAVHSNG